MSKFKCEFEFELIEDFCQWKNHTAREFLAAFRKMTLKDDIGYEKRPALEGKSRP